MTNLHDRQMKPAVPCLDADGNTGDGPHGAVVARCAPMPDADSPYVAVIGGGGDVSAAQLADAEAVGAQLARRWRAESRVSLR